MRRPADEYDAAQERGDVARNGQPSSPIREGLATDSDIGLTNKDIHEARRFRYAKAIGRASRNPEIFHPLEPLGGAAQQQIAVGFLPHAVEDAENARDIAVAFGFGGGAGPAE